jgi:hypothetical protein
MSDIQKDERVLFLPNTRWVRILLVAFFVLLGFGTRLIDISDPPLDFAATRQLHSLILARGYYYEMDLPSTHALPETQRAFGIQAGKDEVLVEPTIMEHLTALTYAVAGGENFEIPRVYSSLFWVLGGIPLFLLARKLMSTNGAIAALAFYELLPFGVIAGRSIQPDPLMISLMVTALYFQYRWKEKDTLSSALLASIFTGLAILVKATAIFFVGIPFIGFVLMGGFKQALRNWRVYLMALISLLPGVLFNVLSATVGGNSGSLFGSRFFPSLYSDPKWYLSWFMMAKSVVDYIPLIMGVLAFFLFIKKEGRVLYTCLWIGYLLQGFVFAYHIYTHNYYQLPIIPMTALGFGLFFAMFMEKIESLKPTVVVRILIAVVLVFSTALTVFKSRSVLLADDYHYEEKYWKQLGEKIGQGTPIVALTHDYGYRLSFWGFVQPTLWETKGDMTVQSLAGNEEQSFEKTFAKKTADKKYFLVTLLNDFKSQKNLYNYLFDHYPCEKGEGYYLFDLTKPVDQ